MIVIYDSETDGSDLKRLSSQNLVDIYSHCKPLVVLRYWVSFRNGIIQSVNNHCWLTLINLEKGG